MVRYATFFLLSFCLHFCGSNTPVLLKLGHSNLPGLSEDGRWRGVRVVQQHFWKIANLHIKVLLEYFLNQEYGLQGPKEDSQALNPSAGARNWCPIKPYYLVTKIAINDYK